MHKTKADWQKEALERQEARNQRTTWEQLKLLAQRPGKSADEVARLKGAR